MAAINTDIDRHGPSFASALWFTGIALRLISLLCLFGLTYMQPVGVLALAAIIGLDLGLYLWQLIRYSTAAGAYLTETGRFWTVTAGGAFFLFSAVLMLSLWAILFAGTQTSAFRQGPDAEASTARPERFSLRVSDDRQSIAFSGVMVQGMMAEVEKTVSGLPTLNSFVLDSPGGDLYEARELARFIQKKGFNTHVTRECSASCLLAFMAGRTRSLGQGAQLGWHRYGLDFTQLITFVSPAAELPKDRMFYLSHGVSSAFLDKALAEERSAIWYPTRSEMVNAGILNSR